MRPSKSGFTLIEVVIVIAMIGILSAIAVPGWLSYRANAKLRGTATDLKANLEKAKLAAIRENDSIAILFAADGSGYTIFQDNGANANNWAREADEDLLNNVRYVAGVTSANDFNNGRFRFNSRGLPEDGSPDPAGTITINGATGTSAVAVNRLGRVQLQW